MYSSKIHYLHEVDEEDILDTESSPKLPGRSGLMVLEVLRLQHLPSR